MGNKLVTGQWSYTHNIDLLTSTRNSFSDIYGRPYEFELIGSAPILGVRSWIYKVLIKIENLAKKRKEKKREEILKIISIHKNLWKSSVFPRHNASIGTKYQCFRHVILACSGQRISSDNIYLYHWYELMMVNHMLHTSHLRLLYRFFFSSSFCGYARTCRQYLNWAEKKMSGVRYMQPYQQ